jgi:hypothetical protein
VQLNSYRSKTSKEAFRGTLRAVGMKNEKKCRKTGIVRKVQRLPPVRLGEEALHHFWQEVYDDLLVQA